MASCDLLTLELVAEMKDGKRLASNGFLLLEGNGELFPDACIECGIYKGSRRQIVIDRKIFGGPIDEQVEAAAGYVLMALRTGERQESGEREEFLELPPGSVRELIANAVCHRSFLQKGMIQVAICDDRLEVASPGRLEGLDSFGRIAGGCSMPRNRSIAEVFRRIGLEGSYGSGIPGIISDCARYGLRPPIFENSGSFFKATIWRRGFDTDRHGVIDPSTRGEREALAAAEDGRIGAPTGEAMALVELLEARPGITQFELGQKLGWSMSQVKYCMGKLRREGLIRREGNNRRGRWVALKR